MNCPKCDHQLGVSRTSRTKTAIIRERRCEQCGERYGTREQMLTDAPLGQRPRHAQGVVYEMLFHLRVGTLMQLSHMSGLSYGSTLHAVSRLVDDGLASQVQPGKYRFVEMKSARSGAQ